MANAHVRMIGSLLVVPCLVACTHGIRNPSPRMGHDRASGLKNGDGDVQQDPVTPALSVISIQSVRLELALASGSVPTAFLKFKMHNQGSQSVAGIVLRVSLVSRQDHADTDGTQTIVAGPFTIRAKRVLRPGYTIEFDLGLRNIGSDCACIPNVEVVAARFAYEPVPSA
jgi:hypothetical protein